MDSSDAYRNSQPAGFAVDRRLSRIKQCVKIADDPTAFAVEKRAGGGETNIAPIADQQPSSDLLF